MSAIRGDAYSHIPQAPQRKQQRADRSIKEPDKGTVKKTIRLSKRKIHIGWKLHPNTGKRIGRAYIHLPELPERNEVMAVIGGSGSGKTVVGRALVEYFSLIEKRAVIIIDPKKNQWWALHEPNDDIDMINILRDEYHLSPIGIPEVEVYVPAYDVPKLTWNTMQHDWHATKTINIKTSSLTPKAIFEIAGKDTKGKDFVRYMERILSVPKSQLTIDYIMGEIRNYAEEPATRQSAKSLFNAMRPLIEMGVISDDGTDVVEMLHPPRKNRPGKVSVISLGTAPTDRKRDVIVMSIMEQVLQICNLNRHLKPVLIIDETVGFCPDKGTSHQNSKDAILDVHYQIRPMGCTRIHLFQNEAQVPDGLYNEDDVPYRIDVSKQLMFWGEKGEFKKEGVGLCEIHTRNVGDKSVPESRIYAQARPSRTKHVG